MSMNLYNPDTGELIQVAGNGTVVVPMPVGTVVQFAGEEVPDGWLLCDGSEYSKLEYPVLYTIIKDRWGTASDDTFKVPDFIGRFAEGSVEIGEYKEAGLPNITGRTWWNSGTVANNSENNKVDLGAFYVEKDSPTFTIGSFAGAASTSLYKKISAAKGETKTDGTLKTEDEYHVYGKSNTVQPNSALIKFIICAVKMDIAGNPEPKYSIGQVSHFLFQPDDPHWLLCDGSTVDADLHPVLASKIPVLPDLRECVLVGAGQNETLTIAEHDVYGIGEFKDDQLQEHTHNIASKRLPMGGGGDAFVHQWAAGETKTSTPNNCRTGTTTHGKQYGVGIYVYAD